MCSDHPGVFVDVDTDEFLGGDPPALMLIALWGIRSQSPKACIQCVEETKQHVSEHKAHEQIASLEALTILHGLTDHLQKKWEGAGLSPCGKVRHEKASSSLVLRSAPSLTPSHLLVDSPLW
jgi:hypothetical protein